MELVIGTIDAPALDSEPVWSLHRDYMVAPDRGMVESIRRFGLLRPIIVRKKQNSIELICGARRTEAARLCGRERNMPCLFVENASDDRDLLELVMEDQKLTGLLSPSETADLSDMFQRIDHSLDDKAVQEATGTRSSGERSRLTSLLALEKPLIQAIHHGSLSVKVGLALKGLNKKERLFLFDLFNRLSLNTGKQRRLLELVKIIAVSEQLGLDEVFARHFPEACNESIDNIPQTSTRMLKKLFEMSHPQLSGTQREFNEKVVQLRLPEKCRLDPWPAFERETVSLTTEFEDFDAFQRVWHRIKDILITHETQPCDQ